MSLESELLGLKKVESKLLKIIKFSEDVILKLGYMTESYEWGGCYTTSNWELYGLNGFGFKAECGVDTSGTDELEINYNGQTVLSIEYHGGATVKTEYKVKACQQGEWIEKLYRMSGRGPQIIRSQLSKRKAEEEREKREEAKAREREKREERTLNSLTEKRNRLGGFK